MAGAPSLLFGEKPDTDPMGSPKRSNVMSFPVVFGKASDDPQRGCFKLLVENGFCSVAVRGRSAETGQGSTR